MAQGRRVPPPDIGQEARTRCGGKTPGTLAALTARLFSVRSGAAERAATLFSRGCLRSASNHPAGFMSYVKTSLGKDERILMMAQFPWPYHFVAWGSLLLLGVVGIGVLIWAMMVIHFITTESALTTRRIVYKKGLFRRETLELGVSTLEQIELRQGFWGRIFGFGVLEVSGTGEGRIRTHPMANPVKFRRLVTDARSMDRAMKIEPGSMRAAMARA